MASWEKIIEERDKARHERNRAWENISELEAENEKLRLELDALRAQGFRAPPPF